jgi:beta-galactosidase
MAQTPDGQIIATQEQEVPGHAHTGRETTMVMHVANPPPTAETPALYTLRTDLIGPDGITHSRTQVAFARSAREGGILRINGQAVKLRGVNRHDEHPDVGRATTPPSGPPTFAR